MRAFAQAMYAAFCSLQRRPLDVALSALDKEYARYSAQPNFELDGANGYIGMCEWRLFCYFMTASSSYKYSSVSAGTRADAATCQ
jgi:hypothetical protein